MLFSCIGSNFVKADKDFKNLVNQLDQEKIQKTTRNKEIQSSFNPPAAPHFCGVHEIMVKAAKKSDQKHIGECRYK